jgi:DNA-binding beta-propeller fold protein YncE
MNRSSQWRFVTVVVVAGWLVWGGGTNPAESVLEGESISPEALSDLASGAMCQWAPVAAHPDHERTPSFQQRAAAAQGGESLNGTVDLSQRKPVRKIADPYPAFSSVAVDMANGEVVMTDENLFNIMVYDRMTNTPPTAARSEPKRMIGGLKTDIEFQCALYVDPKTGDVYAVNNDTQGRMVVFSRKARGDVEPDRTISTPDGTFGIAVSEEHQELILSVQHPSAVVTYRKMAKGEDEPIRLLQGDKTLLADPHGIAYDPKEDVLFVTNHGSVHSVRPSPRRTGADPGVARTSDFRRGFGKKNWRVGYNFAIEEAVPGSGRMDPPSITVYPRAASGDTAPIRIIRGPKTLLNWPTALALHPRTNDLFVANDMGDEILVFPGNANGDVAPTRIIKGPATLIKNPTGVSIDLEREELWVSNFGSHSATVYKTNASGDTPPLRIIRSAPADEPAPLIGNARVAFDSKREQILAPN